MVHVLRFADRPPARSRTIRFDGAEFGTGISFFAVDNEPGEGPPLHIHPYSETWIVKRGVGRFVAGDEVLDAGPNDILVVGPNVPHKFTNVGTDRLEVMCIHDSPRIVQTDLE